MEPDDSGIDLARALQQGQAEALGYASGGPSSGSGGGKGPLIRALVMIAAFGGTVLFLLDALAPEEKDMARPFEIPPPTGVLVPMRDFDEVVRERAAARDGGETGEVAPRPSP